MTETSDPKMLALRLEARWNDTRAAWRRLTVTEKEAKADLKARKDAIEALEASIAQVLREDHEDVSMAFAQIRDFRKKADKRKDALDSATKRWKAEITKRKAALELLLASDMSQLPLLLPDMSMVTDIHVAEELLIVGDPVTVRSVDGVVWFVKGFRTAGEGDTREEVVVVEDEVGNELEVDPGDLERAEAPKASKEEKEPEDVASIFGGLCIGDTVSHKSAGTVGKVVDYAKGSKRVVVVWEGSDATPRDVSPNNLEIVERGAKPAKRIAFKMGDAVQTPNDETGKIVAIVTKESEKTPSGKNRTYPGTVMVQLDGEDEPRKFHATNLRRWKKTA